MSPRLGIIDQPVIEQKVSPADGEIYFENTGRTKRAIGHIEEFVTEDGKIRKNIHFTRENGEPDQIATYASGGIPKLGGNCFNAYMNIMRIAEATKYDIEAIIVSGYDPESALFHAIDTLRKFTNVELIRITTELIGRPSLHLIGPKSTMMFGREHMTKKEMASIVEKVKGVLEQTEGVIVPFYFPELEQVQYLFPTSSAIKQGNLQEMLEIDRWSMRKCGENIKDGNWGKMIPKIPKGSFKIFLENLTNKNWKHLLPRISEARIPKNACLYLNDEELLQIEGPDLQELEGKKLLEACRSLSGNRVYSDRFDMPINLGRRAGGSVAYFAGKGKEYLVETSGEILEIQDEIAQKYGGKMVHNLDSKDKATAGRGDSKPSWIMGILLSRPDPENFTEEELMAAVLGGDLAAMLIHHSKDSNLLYFDEEDQGCDIQGLAALATEIVAGFKEKGWVKITQGNGQNGK